MKKILALTLCLGIALPLVANADPKDKEEKERKKAEKRAEKIEKMIAKRDEQRGRGNERKDREERRDERRVENREERRVENVDTRVREQLAPRVQTESQPQIAVETAVAPQITEVRRQEYRERARERRGPRTHAWSYDEARRYQRRERQSRDWWRSRYNRFALFGGGYYYWDRGYWYPAYGYDTRYNTYRYDEPIYGYNYMEPRQVMVRVQRELRREGYYRGAIDGLIGPMTRAALARFQRDAGLRITRRIDGPTLAALGVV